MRYLTLLVVFVATVAAAPPPQTFNVVIVDVAWTIFDPSQPQGIGHGNYQDPDDDTWHGFIFTVHCGARFMPAESRTDYSEAYWKKPGSRLVLMMQSVGDAKGKLKKCELQVDVRDDGKVYTRPNFPHQ